MDVQGWAPHLIVGLLVGANLSSNPLGWLGALLLVSGFTLGFAGMALSMASSTDNTGAYHAMIMLLNLPLLFLSNALYPLQTMPTWMRVGALINPTTYVVTGLRYMLINNGAELAQVDGIPLWLCFLAIAIFVIAGMWLAYSAFKKSLQ